MHGIKELCRRLRKHGNLSVLMNEESSGILAIFVTDEGRKELLDQGVGSKRIVHAGKDSDSLRWSVELDSLLSHFESERELNKALDVTGSRKSSGRAGKG
ncbi:MAG: hypothetical protein J0M34_03335 [Alphaproteobacteria bacterium]|nr:hypothetical protein [Alphaproteobacteria bacterium]